MLDVLDQLAATSKRTEKEAILTAMTPDRAELFKKIGVAAYTPGITYNIKKYPRPTVYAGTSTLTTAIDALKSLSSRRITGNAAIKFISDLEGSLSAEDGEVLFRIIKKDLRCGVTDSTINKIWPDMIYVSPYQRCSSFSKKNLARLKLPAYSQTKADGMYLDIIAGDSSVIYRSRNCEVKPYNDQETDSLFIPGFVYLSLIHI